VQLAPPQVADYKPGSVVFKNFQIVGSVGAGAMGVVYKAKNLLLNRIVALKVLPKNFLSATDLVRFQNEARTLSRLEHMNIAQVFDFGIGDGGRPYLAMEFIEGPTLQDLLDEHRKIPLNLFYEMMIQICHGLAHAHSKNVIHRDLKTSNIILSSDENRALRAVLVDFGVAKVVSDEGVSTDSGFFLGSPLYTSPEQSSGEPVCPESDTYSLSCVMFQALTGEPPFVGKTILETLTMHRQAPPPLDRLKAIPGIPSELCVLIERGLSKSPADRPESVAEVGEVLTELLEMAREAADDDIDTSSNSLREEIDRIYSERAAAMIGADKNIDHDPRSKAGRFAKVLVVFALVIVAVSAVFIISTELTREQRETKARVHHSLIDSSKNLTGSTSPTPGLDNLVETRGAQFDEFVKRRGNVEVQMCFGQAKKALQAGFGDDAKNEIAYENYMDCIKAIEKSSTVRDTRYIKSIVGAFVTAVMLKREREAEQLEVKLLEKCVTREDAMSAGPVLTQGALSRMAKKEYAQTAHLWAVEAEIADKFFPDQATIADYELSAGTAYLAAKRKHLAKRWLTKAVTRYNAIGAKSDNLMAGYIRLGHISRDELDFKKAVSYYQRAESIAKSLSNRSKYPKVIGHLYIGWADAVYELGNREKALQLIDKAILADRTLKGQKFTLLSEARSRRAQAKKQVR
jgi:serine/threonine protein kinase